MPIEGKRKFIAQVEKFIRIINPKMVILMRYWSNEYRKKFIYYISGKTENEKPIYKILNNNSSEYT